MMQINNIDDRDFVAFNGKYRSLNSPTEFSR